ncbi:hypothetical protein SD10_04665 [Spirosoma radiotolerans]|uniref:histidine kinase n=2 Tax=Spirosoma radiotolerans TaxID=1379870 RepID=A0A0E3ZU91_9BACT|nr:hypothetical protein SD10_04665 [Spirosoma radiotolerans]
MVLWLIMLSECIAQKTPYLNVKPDRIQRASQLEQEARKKNDPILLAEAWYLFGKTYVFAGDYRTAQVYFLKSLRLQEPQGDSFELSRLYVRLSENEDKMGNAVQALRYATRSLQIAQRIKSDEALIRSYGVLGRIYLTQWQNQSTTHKTAYYNQALSFYSKREALSYKIKDTLGIAEATIELGTLFTKVKDPRAIPYLEKALDLFTLKEKQGSRVNTLMHLSEAYSAFGKPALALQALNKAEQLYERAKLNEYETRLDLEAAFVYYFQGSGQWEKAFERLKKLSELERIKLVADRNGAISRLSLEFEAEKKESLLSAQRKEIKLNTQNLRLQRGITMAVSALFLIAVVVSAVFFRLYRKNQRISRRNEDLVKEQNHRVKNNLQVVSSLLSLQSKRLTDELAKKAIEESRLRVQSMAILHQRLYDGDKLAEASLDEFIQEVVSGVLTAYGFAVLQPQFSIDKISLPADKAVPLGLILNELTTNACKYAFADNESPAFRISCHRNNNRIHLTVADNGPGLSSPGLEEAGWSDERSYEPVSAGWSESEVKTLPISFGMQLIQAQAEQLGGTYSFVSGESKEFTGVLFSMVFKA